MTIVRGETFSARCVNHPDREGVGVCIRCRSVVCIECSTKIEGVNHCNRCLSGRVRTVRARGKGDRLEKPLAALAAGALLLMTFLGFLLIGLAVPAIGWFGKGSKLVLNMQRAERVQAAVRAFRDSVGRYPTEDEGLLVLLFEDPYSRGTSIPGWSGSYLSAEAGEEQKPLDDAYGSAIQYVFPSSAAKPALVSLGANRILETDLDSLRSGRPGGGDDLVVWVQ